MKRLNLIVDIGNSTSIFGLFDDDECIARLVLTTYEETYLTKYIKLKDFLIQHQADGVVVDGMIFSVVPSADGNVVRAVKSLLGLKLKVFDWENYNYYKKDPQITDKIGADLVADLIATDAFYGPGAIIVDLGTINKLLFVDDKGIFTSCSFTPGLHVQLESFSKNAELLPRAKTLVNVPETFGRNTVDSMKHGVYWSLINYINSQHEIQEKLCGYKLKLILTGGNSISLEQHIKDRIYDPLLTLKGMNILFKEARK